MNGKNAFLADESRQILVGASYVASKLHIFPPRSGVYRMQDCTGSLLYVGKAKNLRKRLESYAHPERQSRRIAQMISKIAHIELIETDTETEAFLLENDLIKRLKPYYNILLKDDKTFPHILITTKEDYPKIIKHRGARVKQGAYFGPFASGKDVNETLMTLQKAFLLRSCSDSVFKNRSRPCLLHQIKRCSAPCVGKIPPNDYHLLVSEACAFMFNKSTHIQQDLAKKMADASRDQNYETAAILRDRLRALNQIQSQSKDLDNIKECDVIALYQDQGQTCVQVFFYQAGRSCGNYAYFPSSTLDQNEQDVLQAFVGQFYMTHPVPSEILLSHELPDHSIVSKALKTHLNAHSISNKRRLVDLALMNAKEALNRRRLEISARSERLDDLCQLLNRQEPIQRIEIYDNSHIQGTNAVGAMVVATPDGFDKKSYRRFNLDGIDTGNDLEMMQEVLMRRFKRGVIENVLPDIIFIDGGITQLNVALTVLDTLNIQTVTAIGVAKGQDRNAGKETLFFKNKAAVHLDFDTPVLHYIQRLRDEAHRFAIGSHRIKRKNSSLVSGLDEVSGIGSKRKQALLHHFGSLKVLKDASVSEIAKVEGISLALAQKIYSHFNNT